MVIAGFVIVGVIAGWLAGRFMRGNGFGLPGDVAVGVAGALIGGYLFHAVAAEIGFGAALALLIR